MADELARSLRKKMTRQEAKLWLHLRELRKAGFHFRRQAPIKSFIVDFICYHPRVVIELDGSQHSLSVHQRKDVLRDEELAAEGFKIVRVWNNDVDQNLEGVLEQIRQALGWN